VYKLILKDLQETQNALSSYSSIFSSQTLIDEAIAAANTYCKLIQFQKDIANLLRIAQGQPINGIARDIGLMNVIDATDTKETRANARAIARASLTEYAIILSLAHMQNSLLKKLPGTGPLISDVPTYLDGTTNAIINAVATVTNSRLAHQYLYTYDPHYGETHTWTPYEDTYKVSGNNSPTAYAYEILYDDYGIMRTVLRNEMVNPNTYITNTSGFSSPNITDMLYNTANSIATNHLTSPGLTTIEEFNLTAMLNRVQ
jgi:hypothetical protein